MSLAILFEVPGAAIVAWVALHQHPPLAVLPGVALLLAGLAVVVSGRTPGTPPAVPVLSESWPCFVILGVLLFIAAVLVYSASCGGRPKRPPHPPGTLLRTYRRGGRSYGAYVNRRIRQGRPRRRR